MTGLVLAHTATAPVTAVTAGALVLLAAAYAPGLARQPSGARQQWRALAFAVAAGALLVALGPPLEPLTHHRFSAHMAQHLLLTVVAAPALALAAVPRALGFAVGGPVRLGIHRSPALAWWRRSTRRGAVALPVAAGGAHVLALAAWHLPALYDAAVGATVLHLLEHATLLGTAIALWSAVLAARRTAAGSAFAALFATSIASGVLGALITFAPSSLYESYTGPTTGMTVIEDQQLAGVLMWVPGGLVYVIGALAVVATTLRAAERHPAPTGAPLAAAHPRGATGGP